MPQIYSSLPRVYLSRRNLLTLLAKLDRKAAGDVTHRTLIKHRVEGDPYVQDLDAVVITAVDDDSYYATRDPGTVHPAEEETLRNSK
jgi:hypothetical protein